MVAIPNSEVISITPELLFPHLGAGENAPIHRAQHMLIGVRGPTWANRANILNIQKYRNLRSFLYFLTFAAILYFLMASQKPRSHLKTFLEPVASFYQSMSPFQATATPFIPKIVSCVSS